MAGSVWTDRRVAILKAADALEARDSAAWAKVDDLLFQCRSARAEEVEVHRREKAAERIERMLTEEPVESFALPFQRLNKALLGGFRRGQTITLAADPGHGKSVMIDALLEHMAAAGADCHLLINEMSVQGRTCRWIQHRTGIPEERVFAGELSLEEQAQILEEAKSFPYSLTEIAGESFRDVADRLRDLRPDVAAIDLLSRFDYRDEKELRRGMSMLSDAAHQAGCALVIAHHLNQRRASETGFRPTPSLSDLRDSGSVAGFSDVVMFLHRDSNPDEPAQLMETGRFWAAKVRSGSPDGIRVRFNASRLSFAEESG